MELIAYMSFVVVALGVIASPGPNVLVVISTSLSHGKYRGFQTIAGITAAMGFQLMVAALGTTWFIEALAEGFLWLKWAGIGYLLYLGINHLRAALLESSRPQKSTALGSFNRGFWVSLTNPKTILFFGAFLPQFVIPSAPYFEQIILLSVTFWFLAIMVNLIYAILASNIARMLNSKYFSRLQNGASGIFYLGASAALATTDRV